MTNEEIAKELTVALVNRMDDPTTETVFNAYQAILQNLGQQHQIVTLGNIEDHLKKQDKSANIESFASPLALGGAIILAGVTLRYPDVNTGLALLIFGAVYTCWVIFRLFQKFRESRS